VSRGSRTAPGLGHGSGRGPEPSSGLHVLTGAPGTGKSAILAGLAAAGTSVIDEPAREILREQRQAGASGIVERRPGTFVDLLLQRSIEKYLAARRSGMNVIFDRGIPDCFAYAVQLGVDPEPSLIASREHRYDRAVFILAPWEHIYAVDEERTMSFEETLGFHDAIVHAYEGVGYELAEVPQGSIEDRAAFVKASIEGRSLM
jgi:predicted ATPase